MFRFRILSVGSPARVFSGGLKGRHAQVELKQCVKEMARPEPRTAGRTPCSSEPKDTTGKLGIQVLPVSGSAPNSKSPALQRRGHQDTSLILPGSGISGLGAIDPKVETTFNRNLRRAIGHDTRIPASVPLVDLKLVESIGVTAGGLRCSQGNFSDGANEQKGIKSGAHILYYLRDHDVLQQADTGFRV